MSAQRSIAGEIVKRHINPEQFAAWIWFGNDDPPLERLLAFAETKAAEVNLQSFGPPYPRVRDDLPGGFDERSYRYWIESVSDGEDKTILSRLIPTMRRSLGIEDLDQPQVDLDIEFIDPGGSGLKGNIFKARQKSLNRIVAVKIIKPEWGGDALRHAQTMARISGHNNVVVVHMVTKLKNPFDESVCNAMVMEWLEGFLLGDLSRDVHLEVENAERICVGIVSGLRHIHDAGIAHSDLHPWNVMILDDYTPKIIDADEDRHPSFGQMSPASVEAAKASDIENCIANILKVCVRSKLPGEAFMESDLRQAGNLDEIEESVRQIFYASNSVITKRTAPTLLPPGRRKEIREQFEDRIRNNDFWGLTKRCGVIAVGIIPLTHIELEFTKIVNVHLPAFDRNDSNQKRRAKSVASVSGSDGDTYSATEFFDNGSILAADTWVLDPTYHPEKGLIIPSGATCSKVIASLTSYLKILLDLDVPPPFDVFVSLLDVTGYRLLVSNTAWSNVESPTQDICPPAVRIESSTPLGRHEIAQKLRPIFDFIWREFGFMDCDKYTDSGFYNGREIVY